MHAISSYRGNRPTNTHTHPQTGQITIHCAAAGTQCNRVTSTTIGIILNPERIILKFQ